MPLYIINRLKDEKGLNEVHNLLGCVHLPEKDNRTELGFFADEIEAVKYAKEHNWPKADGCYYCCPKAHRG